MPQGGCEIFNQVAKLTLPFYFLLPGSFSKYKTKLNDLN